MSFGPPMALGIGSDYPEPKIDPQCFEWWNADDSTGDSTWTGRVASLNLVQTNATWRPSVTPLAGNLQWATFDGVDDWYNAQAISNGHIFVDTPSTILMLARWDSTGTLLGFGNTGDVDVQRRLKWDSGTTALSTFWQDTTPTSTTYTHQNAVGGAGNYHVVALTDDPTVTNGLRTVWLDGVKYTADPRADNILFSALDVAVIGAGIAGVTTDSWTTMFLREMSVHTRILTSTEIRIFGAGMRARARIPPG